MRRPWKQIIGVVLSAATIGGVAMWGTATSGLPEGTANIWVDANGGTCLRSSTTTEYVDSSACGSLDAANDICQEGDIVLIQGGSYGAQSVNGGNGRTSDHCEMFIADDQTMTIDGSLQFSDVDYLILNGGGAYRGVGARIVTTMMDASDNAFTAGDSQHQVGIFNSSYEVRLRGIDAGGWSILESNHTEISYSDLGPCNNWDSQDPGGTAPHSTGGFCSNGHIDNCTGPEAGGTEGCAKDNTDILIEYNYFHDFGCDDSFYNGQGSDDCHWECAYTTYAKNVTYRGNLFVNCANGGNIFNTFSNGNGAFVGTYGYDGLVMENNVFTQSCSNSSPPCGGRNDEATGIGHCNIHSATPDFVNTIIRFNTFLVSSGFSLPCVGAGGTHGAYIVNANDFIFVGNVMKFPGTSNGCGNDWASQTGGANAYRDYNVFYSGTFTCGTNGTNIGASLAGIVVSDSNTSPDAHLVEGTNPLVDYVPVAIGCPERDFDGVLRPTTGFCDAGALER